MHFRLASFVFVTSLVAQVISATPPTLDPDIKENPSFVHHRPSAADFVQKTSKRDLSSSADNFRRGNWPVWSRRQEDSYYFAQDDGNDSDRDSEHGIAASHAGQPGMAGKETAARPPAEAA
ncbi:hypothetical protein FRB90_011045 [Tulasnella sp. 427]|nr:hypothetical protein FRB90_011045 [Tulasnella sp. 427]